MLEVNKCSRKILRTLINHPEHTSNTLFITSLFNFLDSFSYFSSAPSLPPLFHSLFWKSNELHLVNQTIRHFIQSTIDVFKQPLSININQVHSIIKFIDQLESYFF